LTGIAFNAAPINLQNLQLTNINQFDIVVVHILREDVKMSKDEKKKTKRPTAQKRELRNEKMRLINKSFKSYVRTKMRSFDEALKGQDQTLVQTTLNEIYSVMDRGVKKGLYKPNKAARIKSRLTLRIS
jgi:small subunit ribosomal protein S20